MLLHRGIYARLVQYMLPHVKMLLSIVLTKQKLNGKWTTNKNVSTVSNEKTPTNELPLLRRYSIPFSHSFPKFNNVSCNRKSKMQHWRKREKKKRLLDHTILCLMSRKTKVCQERRGESWKRISCSYQVRKIPTVIHFDIWFSGTSIQNPCILFQSIWASIGSRQQGAQSFASMYIGRFIFIYIPTFLSSRLIPYVLPEV